MMMCCTKGPGPLIDHLLHFNDCVSHDLSNTPQNAQLFYSHYLQCCSETLVVVTADGHNTFICTEGHEHLHAGSTGCIYNEGCVLQSVAAIMKICKAGTAFNQWQHSIHVAHLQNVYQSRLASAFESVYPFGSGQRERCTLRHWHV